MTARDVTALMFRVMGILALIYAVHLLSGIATFLGWQASGAEMPGGTAVLALQFAPLVLLAAGGIVLIVTANRLAGKTAAYDDGPPVTSFDLQSIVFSGLGLFFFGATIVELPGVLNALRMTLAVTRDDPSLVNPRAELVTRLRLAGTLAQGLFGLFLIFRASQLTTFLRRRRDRATVQSADERCPHCGFWVDLTEYRPEAKAFLCGNCKKELPEDLVRRSES